MYDGHRKNPILLRGNDDISVGVTPTQSVILYV
jgi:hypothetical protein